MRRHSPLRFWPRRFPRFPRSMPANSKPSRGQESAASATGNAATGAAHPGAGPRPGGFERVRIHAGPRRTGIFGRVERHPLEPAELWRHRIPHTDALQFRPFRRLPRRPVRTHRAGFASRNFLRRVFHGRQFGAEDGGRTGGRRAAPVARGCGRMSLHRSSACADAVALPGNFVYQWHFVKSLKDRMRRKAKLFPGNTISAGWRACARFANSTMSSRRRTAVSGRLRLLRPVERVARPGEIRVPALMLTAQDDPFVPFASFSDSALAKNPYITLTAPEHGGHCAFISRYTGGERFWAEATVMEFCRQLSAAAFGREEIEEQHRK